jgi:hypothetical protein
MLIHLWSRLLSPLLDGRMFDLSAAYKAPGWFVVGGELFGEL